MATFLARPRPFCNSVVLTNARDCPTVEVWRRNEASISDRDSPDYLGREVSLFQVFPGAREAELEAIADALLGARWTATAAHIVWDCRESGEAVARVDPE